MIIQLWVFSITNVRKRLPIHNTNICKLKNDLIINDKEITRFV